MEKEKNGILLESGTNEIEIMEFTIDGNLYGINVAKVREIMMAEKVHPMPHSHPAVEGIFKPRDTVITVVNLPKYLARRDVAFPKNLQGAHDSAIAAIRYEENEAARKAYEKKYQKLVKKYSFTAMGLSVVVPEDDRQIINEGKILHHCVGGYAERHMAGAATILFLRKEKTPWRSYITIEMCGKKGNDIRQIHGYRNENKAGKRLATPGERHGEFLDLWLAWLNNGSKRDKNGRPVLPVKGEKTA